MKSRKLRVAVLITFVQLLLAGCSCQLLESPYTYYELDMIMFFYKTHDTEIYQTLLPEQFEMPSEPMVMVFFADYYKMDAATEPYKEAAVFLLVDYKGRQAWHCVTMPVTSDDARIGGIKYLGYPKIMGDISFSRGKNRYEGNLKLKNKTVMKLALHTQKRKANTQEVKMFDWLKGVTSYNILYGNVYEPKFGPTAGSITNYSLLKLAAAFPDKLEIKVGRADLAVNDKAAAAYSKRMGDIYSIRPSRPVLAYYLKSKAVMRFNP